MTDWRSKIIEIINMMQSEKKLHYLYNLVVRLYCSDD